jgi:hypothetical protein
MGVPSVVGALCSLCLCIGTPGAGASVLLMTITTAMDGPREAGAVPTMIDMTREYSGA